MCIYMYMCMYIVHVYTHGTVFNIIHVYFIYNETPLKRSTQNVSLTNSMIKVINNMYFSLTIIIYIYSIYNKILFMCTCTCKRLYTCTVTI